MSLCQKLDCQWNLSQENLFGLLIIEKYPDYKDLFHKSDFLLIKAKKH